MQILSFQELQEAITVTIIISVLLQTKNEQIAVPRNH